MFRAEPRRKVCLPVGKRDSRKFALFADFRVFDFAFRSHNAPPKLLILFIMKEQKKTAVCIAKCTKSGTVFRQYTI